MGLSATDLARTAPAGPDTDRAPITQRGLGPDPMALAATLPSAPPSASRAVSVPDTLPSFPRTSTAEMPDRPRRPPTSPVACSVDAPLPAALRAAAGPSADIVVFPGERIARLDDFVRLRLDAEHPTFVATLARRGLTPDYVAVMWRRFQAARRLNESLDAEYARRLRRAADPPPLRRQSA